MPDLDPVISFELMERIDLGSIDDTTSKIKTEIDFEAEYIQIVYPNEPRSSSQEPEQDIHQGGEVLNGEMNDY